MIRSLATTATSSRGGSKNGNRIGGARCKCGSQKLDVAPSRLATSSSPDQRDNERDNGGGENSRSIPTMTHTIRQEYAHPLGDFSQAISRLRGQLLVRQGLTPLRVIYRRLPSRSGPECRVARSSSRLRVGLALSCLECQWRLSVGPETRAEGQGSSPGRHRRSNRERNS
jgi:hypothetical protein